jgi:hypothetical protein
MMYFDALHAIIDDGIEAARLDYGKPHDKLKLDGALLGFEECRGKGPVEMAKLLTVAAERTSEAYRTQAVDYWYWRCRELEIEWVANVVSALLMHQGLPIIAPVTVRGLRKAMDIVGVKLPTA